MLKEDEDDSDEETDKIPEIQKFIDFKYDSQESTSMNKFYYNDKKFVLNFLYSFNADKEINRKRYYKLRIKHFKFYILQCFSKKNIIIDKFYENVDLKHISVPIGSVFWASEEFSNIDLSNPNVSADINNELTKGFIIFPPYSVVITLETRASKNKKYKMKGIDFKFKGEDAEKYKKWNRNSTDNIYAYFAYEK